MFIPGLTKNTRDPGLVVPILDPVPVLERLDTVITAGCPIHVYETGIVIGL